MNLHPRWRDALLWCAGSLCALTLAQPLAVNETPDRAVIARAVSTRADRVSGGDVLVEVTPPGRSAAAIAVTIDGRDVTGAFRPRSDGTWLGLVDGLSPGPHLLRVSGEPWRLPDGTLEIQNYPSSGPIVSGPPQTPFVCQTERFKLPDGSTLGPSRDAGCSFPTRVHYLYLPQDRQALKPLPSRRRLPADVAWTNTLTGAAVPFVVRVETGAMNRGIYQNVILHDPTSEPPPSPFAPPAGWNRRLIAVHGVGCPSGWYRQGAAMGVDPLNIRRLGEGYALFTNTLNHPTNSCNAFLAGETTMMGKERFIETFGPPLFTISMGTSGGAYTSLQVADAFPGLIDGVLITSTFPDALSIGLAGLDARLVLRYFLASPAEAFTEAQQVAITGYQGWKAFVDAANQAQRTDPVPARLDLPGYQAAVWDGAIPQALRYHPVTNPAGARPTLFDAARNIYGIDERTGFARRPYDNVGVQYGLRAFNDGAITLEQFLDLNAQAGGYDSDANFTVARTSGDPEGIRRTYESGLTLGANGGLASIPVFDAGGYNETDRYHYQWFHFAVRERLQRQNGRVGNHLMWRGSVPPEQSWALMEGWLSAIAADRDGADPYARVVRNRPERAVDGCWPAGANARFIAEPQTFSALPDSDCNRQLPSYSSVRHAAGGPLDGNVLKCQLKPVDADDYRAALSAHDLERVRATFPDGVCDWRKAGVNQVPVAPWTSFGPAPRSVTAPRSN